MGSGTFNTLCAAEISSLSVEASILTFHRSIIITSARLIFSSIFEIDSPSYPPPQRRHRARSFPEFNLIIQADVFKIINAQNYKPVPNGITAVGG